MKKLESIGKSSTGLNENTAGLVSILFGWVSGLVFFLIEKDSSYVKFHALQSLIFFGSATIIVSVFGRIGFIGGIISSLIGLATLAGWIILMIKAYQGEWFELPVIGEIARKNTGN